MAYSNFDFNIELLQLLSSSKISPNVVEKTMSILKCVSILIYYNYEKEEISWHEDEDEEESMGGPS